MSPNACDVSSGTEDDVSSGTEDDGYNIPETTHSVIFKCIGAHKETEYQEILAMVSKNIDNGKCP